MAAAPGRARRGRRAEAERGGRKAREGEERRGRRTVAGARYLWARRPRPLRTLLRFLEREATSLRQGLLANLVSSGGDLLAGLALGFLTHTLERLPGLLVLVPAAIGMRGNIFGALGSRFGTYAHTGTFRLSLRRGTVVGQNLYAVTVLTFVVSGALAVVARAVSSIFGQPAIGVLDLLVISVLGGVFSSVLVGALTLLVARLSVSRNWDMDNVTGPLVTAAGDVVTLPALFLATFAVGHRYVTVSVGTVLAVVCAAALVIGLARAPGVGRRILYESLPVLLLAGTVDVVAGLTIEKRLDRFVAVKALFVLIPSFLEDSGSLGAILSARLSSKLHTGLLTPRPFPREALPDVALIYVLAVPVYLFAGTSAALVSDLFGLSTPGYLRMLGVAGLGGIFATTGACIVAYYTAVASFRLGLDPDNHGIPIVTSSMDLIGAFSIIGAILILGLG